MKYSFNEKELLGLFVSNNDSRPLFMHPYLKDGYVCATDNRQIIRIKADMLSDKYKPTCGGSGSVFWEYNDNNFKSYVQEFDCPVCDGSGYVEEVQVTGKMIPDWNATVGIVNYVLRIKYVQTLLEAMKIIGVTEVHLIAQVDNKSLFKVDDNISIIIMACLADADCIIKTKKILWKR